MRISTFLLYLLILNTTMKLNSQIIVNEADIKLSDYSVKKRDNLPSPEVSIDDSSSWQRLYLKFFDENLVLEEVLLALDRAKEKESVTYLNLLRIMLIEGNQEPITELESLLRNPMYEQNVWLYCFLANLYYYELNYEQTSIFVDKILTEHPKFGFALILKVYINHNDQKFEDNLKLFNYLHSTYGELDCDIILMQTYIAIHHYDEAKGFYLSRLNPSDWMKLMYADLLWQDGNAGKAQDLLDEVIGEEYQAYKRSIIENISLMSNDFGAAEFVYLENCAKSSYTVNALIELLDFYSRNRAFDKLSVNLEQYGKNLSLLDANVYDWYIRNGNLLDEISSPVELYKILSFDEYEYYSVICRIEGW